MMQFQSAIQNDPMRIDLYEDMGVKAASEGKPRQSPYHPRALVSKHWLIGYDRETLTRLDNPEKTQF